MDFILLLEGWILDNSPIDSYYSSLFARLNHRRDSWIIGRDLKCQPLRRKLCYVGRFLDESDRLPHGEMDFCPEPAPHLFWGSWHVGGLERHQRVFEMISQGLENKRTLQLCLFLCGTSKKTSSGWENPLAQRSNETAFLVHDLICQTNHFPGKSVCISPTSSFHLSVVILAPWLCNYRNG